MASPAATYEPHLGHMAGSNTVPDLPVVQFERVTIEGSINALQQSSRCQDPGDQ